MEIKLSSQHTELLNQMAQKYQLSENAILEKALEILSNHLEETEEKAFWMQISESALRKIWDNDEDAAYDNWEDLYGISKG